jgi:hypothetical protein
VNSSLQRDEKKIIQKVKVYTENNKNDTEVYTVGFLDDKGKQIVDNQNRPLQYNVSKVELFKSTKDLKDIIDKKLDLAVKC